MATETAVTTDERDRIEQFVTEWLSDCRIPGGAVAVVRDDATYAEGFGARDVASNAPATADTAYGVASVTKSFTALAVLQQVERGAIALDDPVMAVDWYGDDPPTVHELLCHGSGIPSDGASVALIARLTGDDAVEIPLSSDADLRRHVAGAVDDRAEGDRFFYYNSGYTALGTLVERLDGRSFPAYVADEILAPLGMERSVVAPDDFDTWDDVMTPYRPDEAERVECPLPVKGVGAAGGLVASVTDLANYLQFQLDPDGSVGEEGSVIDPALLGQAHEGHTTRQTYTDGAAQRYGYGWMRRSLLGEPLIEHGGSLGVSTAYVGFLPESDTAVALACNDSPDPHPQFVGPALLARLRGEPATATRYYALRDRAERVAGGYESYRGVQTATVESDGGSLNVEFETALGGETVTAHPVSTDGPLRWETTAASGARVPLTFEATDDGVDLFYRRWRLHPV